MADPRVIKYHNNEKLWNEEKIQEELAKKQDSITPDTVVKVSENLVTNRAIKEYVDNEAAERKATDGDLDTLKTAAKSNLVEAINELKDSAYTVDSSLSDTSTNPVQNKAVKASIDAGDASTLNDAKQYTDDKLDLNTNDGTTVTELTGHLEDLNNAAESLVSAINKEGQRIDALENKANSLEDDLSAEKQARIEGDEELDRKITKLDQEKQDNLTFDEEPTHGSTNPVTSEGIKHYVDEITGELEDLETPAESLVSAINKLDKTAGKLVDLETPAESLVEAINSLDEKVNKNIDIDEAPVEDSEHLVKSGGVFDAIRFASVKVGETMYWPVSEKETRTVHSDETVEFTFNGETHTVTPVDGTVDMCISKDIPDGWHALDGSVELVAADYPDLAAFIPDNVTTDGRIWLPYVQQKIIKVKY